MKKLILSAAISLATFNAGATGIPTVDVIANEFTFAKVLLDATKWTKQLEEWDFQLDELKGTHKALRGVKNLGDVFDSRELRQYFPPEFTQVYGAIRNNGLEALFLDARALRALNKVFENCHKIKIEDRRMQCEANAVQSSQDSAIATNLYDKTVERTQQISKLQEEINGTGNLKDIADLQARIDIEVANIANLSTQVEAMNMKQDAETRINQQRTLEMEKRALYEGKGFGITKEGLTFD